MNGPVFVFIALIFSVASDKIDDEIVEQRPDMNIKVAAFIPIGQRPNALLDSTLNEVQILRESRGLDKNVQFEKKIYLYNIDEEQRIGRYVGSVKAFYQGSSKDIRYALVMGGDNFSIHSEYGMMHTTAVLDYEEVKSYQLIVKATVGDTSIYGLCLVNISVNDINDNSPMFAASNDVTSVDESADWYTTIYMAHATDEDDGDNGRITYSLKGPSKDRFHLNKNEVMSYGHHTLDRETQSHYELIIVASDAGTPRRSSSMTLTINVLDVNDNNPKFMYDHYYGFVTLSINVNDTILQVSASDADDGENGRVIFNLPESEWSETFGLHPDGTIYLKKTVDHGPNDVCVFSVVAHDPWALYSTALVTVYFVNTP